MSQPVMSKGYQRRNYFIDKEFQSKFIMKFCALVAIGAGLTIVLLYVLARSSTTVAFVKARVTVMTTADFIFPLLVQTVAVATVLVSLGAVMVTLFVSHQIAGPLYRFKQTLREIALGNLSHQVRLRKGDQLHDIATEFNQTITAVRGRICDANAALTAVKQELDTISEFQVEDSKRKHFIELRKKVGELERAIVFFRT